MDAIIWDDSDGDTFCCMCGCHGVMADVISWQVASSAV